MNTANDPKQIKLRKYENILAISGVAVIAFGVWTIIKSAFYLLLQPFDIEIFIPPEQLAEMEAEMGPNVDILTSGVIVGAIFFILFLDLLLRFYIGKSAYADGRARKRKRVIYVIVAIIMAVAFANDVWVTVSNLFIGEPTEQSEGVEYMRGVLTSVLLDMTSLLALIELIVSAIQVRRLRKELGIEVKNSKDELTILQEETSEIIEHTGIEV